MAYNVEMTFYRTGKQAWSTFIPEYSNTDTKVLGEIFEPYDILSPTIIINNEAMTYPEGHIPYTINEYNYVYIDTLDRYYWIKDWVRNNGLWYGYCAEDVLASFRSDILNTTQYVLRSSTTYDNSIIDYNYTYKLSDYIVNSVGMDRVEGGTGSWISLSDFRPEQHEERMLVLNVNPCGTNWYIDYEHKGNSDYCPNIVVCKASDYSRLMSAVKNSDAENVIVSNYINNAYWIPMPFTEQSQKDRIIENLVFGSYLDAKADNFDVTKGSNYRKTWNNFAPTSAWAVQPNHNIDCIWEGTIPDISNITYENSADYKTVMLRFHPFGEFPLDSNLLAGTTKIRVRVSLNVATGMAELSYRQQAPNIGSYIVLSNTNVAVPIQLSTIINNHTAWQRQHIANWVQLGVSATGAAGRAVAMQGKLASSMSGAFGSGGSAAQTALGTSGNFQQVTGEGIATIGADVGGITNAIVNLVAEKPVQFANQVSGAYGSTLMDYNPIIITYRNKIVDRMDNRFGRPLCKPMKLGDLGGGVCVCQNAVFGGSGIGNRALLSERQAIEQALNGGIYID